MKSPFQFIVKPKKGKRYNNTKDIGGVEVVTSSSKEDHIASNREAIVISTPVNYTGPVKEGDTLLVHHNVFKYYLDVKGKQRSGKSHYRDDLFFIDNEQFYMYKNENGWNPYNRYCFVKPAPVEDSYIAKGVSEEPLIGYMKYPNGFLTEQGVKPGDKISFKPDSEYEFTVDGEKLYRMFDHQITLVF